MNLESKIEAFLFFKGESVSFKELANVFKETEENIEKAVQTLSNELSNRGIRIVLGDREVMVGTPSEMGDFFEEIRKEELNKELSKAALETLSIVLYRKRVSRGEINFIRGVNSGFILRALEVRGLVKRESSNKDARVYEYGPTLELLSFMGVTKIEDLPRFEEIRETLETKLKNQSDENK
ncbi:MAG: SMC-Scp complex subunit ScpB [Bacteroidetes bacterium]|nr:SMC-Scp complex subunit ScpB [Bacteroidota bacterium]